MFICIPSYQRAEICNTKTLRMLHQHKVPKEMIIVFVANKTEYTSYISALNPMLYGEIRIGRKGLVQQREYIMRSFPSNEYLVFLDDDVESVDFSLSKNFQHGDMVRFLQEAFEECIRNKCYIWGVYPVFNPFFRKPRPEVHQGLIYIVGAFYGIINRPCDRHLKLRITKDNGQKEDVERSILYFLKDGNMLRFDRIGFVTKYYGKTGGLGTFDSRLEPMREAAMRLKELYPELGNIFVKKTGMTEFKLRKRPPINTTSKQ